jgi:hypothetical protein
METNVLVPIIIVAMITVVPGVWALFEQIRKDKTQTQMNMAQVGIVEPLFDEIQNLKFRTSELQKQTETAGMKLSELSEAQEIHEDDLIMISDMKEHSSKKISVSSMTEMLWKMMYERPVIVRCEHCNSPNVITSLNCTQCGAPLKE